MIDTVKKEFRYGALGPAVIVGSAAFNLLMIIAVCIVMVPSSEVRVTKDLPTFYTTAFFSMIAYIWMAVILLYVSPRVVEMWEAIVPLVMLFPLVGASYMVDKGYANGCFRAMALLRQPLPEAVEEDGGEHTYGIYRQWPATPLSSARLSSRPTARASSGPAATPAAR